MNKIKLISLLLCAAMLCTVMAGCKKDSNPKLPDGAVAATGDLSPESVPSSDPAPYTKGKVEGNVYTNEAADLTLRIPTGWIVADDYELSTLMGITYNFEDPDAYLAEVAKSADIFDLIMKDSTEDFSVMILFQDMAQFSDMTAAEFLEMQKAQLSIESATVEKSDVTEVSYSGNKYAMLKAESTPAEGTKVTQLFFARIVDGRMMSIMMTSPADEPINPDTIFA